MALKQMVGLVFGRLTVVARSSMVDDHAWWTCSCSACGRIKDIRGVVLRRGDAMTCGCSQAKPRQRPGPVDLPPPIFGAKWIKITKGKFALVDEADFERVRQFNWSIAAGRYAARREHGSRTQQGALTYMHRFIIGALPGQAVDHLNHDTLDNRRLNLRPATTQENCRHTRLRRDNTSGKKGVWFDQKRKVWRAEIKVSPTQKKYIGAFTDLEEAGRAYDLAAVSYFKAFAYTNTDVEAKR